eukprot:2501896-Alexandrium_andersonii.AAC.1
MALGGVGARRHEASFTGKVKDNAAKIKQTWRALVGDAPNDAWAGLNKANTFVGDRNLLARAPDHVGPDRVSSGAADWRRSVAG